MHQMKIWQVTGAVFILGIIISSCSFRESKIAPEVVTPTPTIVAISASQFPTQEPTAELGAEPTLPPTSTPVSCATDASQVAVRYDVDANLNWDTRAIEVKETINYRNDSVDSLNELVFHVEPNRFADVMGLYGILNADGSLLMDAVLSETRLTVPLSEPLHPGCQKVVQLHYNLQIPSINDTFDGRYGYFGYSGVQVNLGHWLVTAGVYKGDGEWYTPQAYPVGEQTSPVAADYAVKLTIESPPIGLQVAGPGQRSRVDGYIWNFTLTSARDFAISISDRFQVVNATVDGTIVEVYYIPATQPIGLNAPEHTLTVASQSLRLYSELFGAYPYERLVIVEGDFPDGMEFSGIVFVGEAWFRLWKGQDSEWLTLITVHEVAHQWWYLQVANDQANDPYLDEMLATYSEVLFMERYYPGRVNWWWDFRINSYFSQQDIDLEVYRFNDSRPYINAVYLRAVVMLDVIRETIGDDEFLAWLNRYLSIGRGNIANPEDFWGALRTQDYFALEYLREIYMAQPDVLQITPTPANE